MDVPVFDSALQGLKTGALPAENTLMRTLQDRLNAALDLIPTSLEPGEDAPNFTDLTWRIALLQRQQLALGLQAWVQDNGHWLAIEGLRLHSAHNRPGFGIPALTFFESRDEEVSCSSPHKVERDEAIDRLVGILDLSHSPTNEHFIEYVVEDLNQVRWNPLRLREVLTFKLADGLPDPVGWLRRHTAYRQAKLLENQTPLPLHRPGRPRL